MIAPLQTCHCRNYRDTYAEAVLRGGFRYSAAKCNNFDRQPSVRSGENTEEIRKRFCASAIVVLFAGSAIALTGERMPEIAL
jgi:hypothetical protein